MQVIKVDAFLLNGNIFLKCLAEENCTFQKYFFFVLALCFDVALFFKNYNRMLILSSKSDVKKTFFIKVILSS